MRKLIEEIFEFSPFIVTLLLRFAFLLTRFGSTILEYTAAFVTSLSFVTVFASSILGIIYYKNSSDRQKILAVRVGVINCLRGIAIVPISYLLLHLLSSIKSTIEFVNQNRWWMIISLIASALLLAYATFLQHISDASRGKNQIKSLE